MPLAVEFHAYVELGRDGATAVLVRYDEVANEIELLDQFGKSLLRAKVEQPVEFVDGVFSWQGRDLQPLDGNDELAIAFAHLVNASLGSATPEGLLSEPLEGVVRYQYAIVNIGMFRSPERMGRILALAGQHGWRLVGVYDKASNWLTNMEKGFMMLIRPVPDGATPREWCLILRG